MTRPIPEQIVAAVSALAESLATWCEEGRDGRLEQHEAAVLERVRQVLPRLLEAVVAVATSELAPRVRGQRSACPGTVTTAGVWSRRRWGWGVISARARGCSAGWRA